MTLSSPLSSPLSYADSMLRPLLASTSGSSSLVFPALPQGSATAAALAEVTSRWDQEMQRSARAGNSTASALMAVGRAIAEVDDALASTMLRGVKL